MSSFETDLDTRTVAQINGILGHAHRVTNAYRAAASKIHDMGARALVGRLLRLHVRAVDMLEDALASEGWMFPTRADMTAIGGEESLHVSGVNADDAILEALSDIDAWLVASAGRRLPHDVSPRIGAAIAELRDHAASRRDQLLLSDHLIHAAQGVVQ